MGKVLLTRSNFYIGARVSPAHIFYSSFKGQNVVDGVEVLGTIMGEVDPTYWVYVQWDGGPLLSYPLEYLQIEETLKTTNMGKVIVTEQIASVGMRVHRGRDWPSCYDHQDRYGGVIAGKQVSGEIVKISRSIAQVKWDGNPGGPFWYDIGNGESYHLYFGEHESTPESAIFIPTPAPKPICVYNGRNSFSTWNIEKDSQPLVKGDELMCVVDSSYVSLGHVVTVTSSIMNWQDSSGPTIAAEMHNGKTESYYLKRYVPYGNTAVRLGYINSEGMSATLKPKSLTFRQDSYGYMNWENLNSNNNPIRIGDVLVNVKDAGEKGQLWVVTKIPHYDGGEWLVDVYMFGKQKSEAAGYYLKRFAPYGDLARRISYTGVHTILTPTPTPISDPGHAHLSHLPYSTIEVGDRVKCIDTSKGWVKTSPLRYGDLLHVKEVGSTYIAFMEDTNPKYLEKECFEVFQKKGTFIPPSNYQTIKTNKDVTDTRSGEALKVQRPSCFLSGAGGYPTNPVQGRRSKTKLG